MNNILSIVWIFFMILNGTKGLTNNELLVDFNSVRGDAAWKNDYSNMWQLSWDKEMLEIAESFAEKEVDDFENGDNYRLFLFFGSDFAWDIQNNWTNAFTSSEVKKISKVIPDGDEKLNKANHPREMFMMTQTKIGCVAYHKTYEFENKKCSFEYLCAIGPNGYRRMSGISIQTNGKPGTNCINGHNNGDGLCVPGLATTAEPPKPTATSDQEFATKDPEAEEWDLILNLNSADGKGTLFGFFMAFAGVLIV